MIALLRAVHITHLVDFMIMMPLGPHFIRAFGISAGKLGGLVFAYTCSAAIAGVLVGAFIDRFERRKVLFCVYVGFALSLICSACADSFEALIAARVFAGACGGILSAMIQTIVADAVPLEQRAAAIGRVMTGNALAAVIGVPLGLMLASALGWRTPFVVLVLLSPLVLYGIARGIPAAVGESPGVSHGGAACAGAGFRLRIVVPAYLLTFTITCSAYSVVAYLAPYLVANVGLAEPQLPFVYLCGGALTFFSSPWIGRLADRYGRNRIFALVTVLSAIAMLGVTHAPILPVGVAIALCSVFFVVVYGRWVPAVALLSDIPPPAARGAFMMLNGVVTQMGMGAGALFTGAVIDHATDGTLRGFGTVGYSAALMSLLAILLARGRLRPA